MGAREKKVPILRRPSKDEEQSGYEKHVGPGSSGFIPLSQRHLVQPSEYNPEPTTMPPPTAGLSGQHLRDRYVVSVIGLPLRGKGHLARRVQRYLEFFHGAYVEVIDISNFLGPTGDDQLLEELRKFFAGTDDNSENAYRYGQKKVDGRVAILVAGDTYKSLGSLWSGVSKRRRRYMAKLLQKEIDAQIIFIEVKHEHTVDRGQAIAALHEQYTDRLVMVKGLDRQLLERQLKEYHQDYVTIQDDGGEDDLAYMKIVNFNQKVLANNMMSTFVGSKLVQFCSSVHPYTRTIYLTRHGETIYNQEKKIGGDSSLSHLGREFAKRLAQFSELVVAGPHTSFVCVTLEQGEVSKLRDRLSRLPPPRGAGSGAGVFAKGCWQGVGDVGQHVKMQEGMALVRLQVGESTFEKAPLTIEGVLEAIGDKSAALIFVEHDKVAFDADPRPARLWTSSLKRTKETAEYIRHPVIPLQDGKEFLQMDPREYRNLDEVYAGEFEGRTYDFVMAHMNSEFELRRADKLGYRYPRGESYFDIIARLEEPMQKLESKVEPLLIVSHQATLRLTYAYLKGIPRDEATGLEMPLHSVIKLEFDGASSEVEERRYFIGPHCPIDSSRKGML